MLDDMGGELPVAKCRPVAFWHFYKDANANSTIPRLAARTRMLIMDTRSHAVDFIGGDVHLQSHTGGRAGCTNRQNCFRHRVKTQSGL